MHTATVTVEDTQLQCVQDA